MSKQQRTTADAPNGSARRPVRGVDRRHFLQWAGLAGAGLSASMLFSAGCQTAQPPPSTGAASSTPARSSTPGGAAGDSPPADWQPQWDALVAAARQEGTVVLGGAPPTPETRQELPEAFKRRFGVTMEYLATTTGSTADVVNKAVAERSAGQHTIDVIVGGSDPLYSVGYPEKLFDPIPPALIHPEATDPARWTGGKVWYMDPDQQYILRLSNQVSLQLSVNTDSVNPAEFKSWRDLLDPRYTGRISAFDYGVPSTGSVVGLFLFEMLGEDYVKALYQGQRVTLSQDARQIGDWLARGTYPITLGLGARDIEALRREGFPIAVALTGLPDAPSYLTAGFGLAVLVNQAPHPNAAKLLVNWLAMPEGQEVWNRTQRLVSVRTDLDNSWAPDYIIPKPGVQYVDNYEWERTLTKRGPDQVEHLKQLLRS
jgi:iron(III) transport system substrate-binding protein